MLPQAKRVAVTQKGVNCVSPNNRGGIGESQTLEESAFPPVVGGFAAHHREKARLWGRLSIPYLLPTSTPISRGAADPISLR